MPSVDVSWKGHCRNPGIRYRLLGYLDRLARRNDVYLREGERPHLTVVGAQQERPRPTIEVVEEVVSGEVLISSAIAPDSERLVTRARESGLVIVEPQGYGPRFIRLDAVYLRGLNFKLFDPRDLFPGDDRMSFVFMECPEHHFLDGRLVKVSEANGKVYLTEPSIRLDAYLEDWTDCLFSWIRYFLVGDFWWHRGEELRGYADYRGVFEELQTARGSEDAEDATFDAILSTFEQHAEHEIGERESLANAGKA